MKKVRTLTGENFGDLIIRDSSEQYCVPFYQSHKASIGTKGVQRTDTSSIE